MKNQHPISAKLDILAYAWLKSEAAASGIACNRIINRAIMAYVSIMRQRRLLRNENEEEQNKTAQQMAKYLLGLEEQTIKW